MFWKKIPFRNYFLAAAIFTVISLVAFLSTKTFLPPVIPLFYGKPAGSEQLAPVWYLLLVPGVSFLSTIINMVISTFISDTFIKNTLAVVSLVISIMATITLIKIILLVGFF